MIWFLFVEVGVLEGGFFDFDVIFLLMVVQVVFFIFLFNVFFFCLVGKVVEDCEGYIFISCVDVKQKFVQVECLEVDLVEQLKGVCQVVQVVIVEVE